MALPASSRSVFRSEASQAYFAARFMRDDAPTWADLSRSIVDETCGDRLSRSDRAQLVQFVADMKLLPSAALLSRRAGAPQAPDALLLRAGNVTAEMGRAAGLAQAALWQGTSVGIDLSDCASGPADLLARLDVLDAMTRAAESLSRPAAEPRRPAAMLAGLSAGHPDLAAFLQAGDPTPLGERPALGRTMRLVHFDTAWLLGAARDGDPGEAFRSSIAAALRTGTVALGFNLFDREADMLRSPAGQAAARTDGAEILSAVINLSRIETLAELAGVTQLATQFLLCRAAASRLRRADDDRAPAPRLALGLIGLHEWLLRRGHGYEPAEDLGLWLSVYRGISDETAAWFADCLGMARPAACRGVAAERDAARLAGTTAGLDPLPAVAYRTLGANGRATGAAQLHPLAASLSALLGIGLDRLDSGLSLASDPGRSLAVQAAVQAHVDQCAVATVSLPRWDAKDGAERVQVLARQVASQAHGLRTVTLEPEGAFGRPARVAVDPSEAVGPAAEAA